MLDLPEKVSETNTTAYSAKMSVAKKKFYEMGTWFPGASVGGGNLTLARRLVI